MPALQILCPVFPYHHHDPHNLEGFGLGPLSESFIRARRRQLADDDGICWPARCPPVGSSSSSSSSGVLSWWWRWLIIFIQADLISLCCWSLARCACKDTAELRSVPVLLFLVTWSQNTHMVIYDIHIYLGELIVAMLWGRNAWNYSHR